MIYTIQNQHLTVGIEDLGAQLAFVCTPKGTEYLWQGNPAIWSRRAPLLFPLIGRLKDSSYLVDGKQYTISSHGFARDSVFQVVDHTDTSISFRMEDSEETLAVYPFSFSLTVTYTLEENSLKKSHHVENRSETTMYYELGGHDGFRAPLAPAEMMSDYAISIPGVDSTIQPYGMDAACMVTPKEQVLPISDGRIPLVPMSFGLDTIILDDLPQRKAALVDRDGNARVTLEFEDFPYLALWTKDAPLPTNYVCIEPWSSLPDAVFAGRELSLKQGVRALASGADETLSYTTIFS